MEPTTFQNLLPRVSSKMRSRSIPCTVFPVVTSVMLYFICCNLTGRTKRVSANSNPWSFFIRICARSCQLLILTERERRCTSPGYTEQNCACAGKHTEHMQPTLLSCLGASVPRVLAVSCALVVVRSKRAGVVRRACSFSPWGCRADRERSGLGRGVNFGGSQEHFGG